MHKPLVSIVVSYLGPAITYYFWRRELRRERKKRELEHRLFCAIDHVSMRDAEMRENKAYVAGFDAGRAA